MKITETTTLAELQKYLRACGDPFVTLMSGHPHGAHPRHAIIHVPELGTFHGGGATVAEAMEAAFREYRRATLPEPLKPYAGPAYREEKRYDTIKGTVGVNERTHHGITDPNGTFGSPGNTVHRSQRTPAFPGTINHDEIHRWVASSTDYTPGCAQIVRADDGAEVICGEHPVARIHCCHGCGHLEQDHPNETGCEHWHHSPTGEKR